LLPFYWSSELSLYGSIPLAARQRARNRGNDSANLRARIPGDNYAQDLTSR